MQGSIESVANFFPCVEVAKMADGDGQARFRNVDESANAKKCAHFHTPKIVAALTLVYEHLWFV